MSTCDRDLVAQVLADPLNPAMSAVEFWDKLLGHRCDTECDKRHYGRVRLVLDGDRYRTDSPCRCGQFMLAQKTSPSVNRCERCGGYEDDRSQSCSLPMIPWSADWDELAGLI